MGPATNPKAVVDERLKVHGVNRLRVIDASVMPKVIAGMSKEHWGQKEITTVTRHAKRFFVIL